MLMAAKSGISLRLLRKYQPKSGEKGQNEKGDKIKVRKNSTLRPKLQVACCKLHSIATYSALSAKNFGDAKGPEGDKSVAQNSTLRQKMKKGPRK